MTDLMTDGRIDSIKVGAAVAAIKDQARSLPVSWEHGGYQAIESALDRMAELVYEMYELVKAERAKADNEVFPDPVNRVAANALMLYRSYLAGEATEVPWSTVVRGIRVYADAAGITFQAAEKATMDAYEAYYGKPPATPGQPG